MDQRLSLPDEILFKIFIQLDINTLNTLCGINHFRNKISSFFTIVTDDPTECNISLSNFPQSCLIHYSDDTQIRACNSWGLLFVMFNVSDEALIETVEKKTKLCTFTLMGKELDKLETLDELEDPLQKDYHEIDQDISSILEQAAKLNERIQMLSFCFITELHLGNVELNPATLDFTQLKWLKLSECRSINELAKFDFPMIEGISISGECKSIFTSLDFGKYPKVLEISPTDIDIIENITFAEVTDLSISNLVFELLREEFTQLRTIRNIVLPKLKNISITGILYLININSTSVVEYFKVSNIFDRETHFQTIYFPYLKHLHISDTDIGGINSLYAPACHRLTVSGSEFLDGRAHIGLLDQINHLTWYDCNITISKRIDSSGLISLWAGDLTKKVLEDITSMDFPKLSELLLNFELYNVGPLGYSIKFAPMLTDVKLLYSTGLGILRNTWSTLKNLKLEMCGSWSLDDATLDNLETFELQVGKSSDFVKMSNCHFPKLITLAVCNNRFGGQTEGVFENIKAPLLESIVYEMSVDTLDLTMSCSNLRSVDIQNVSCLVLGKNQSLKEFTSRDNYLKRLVTSKDGGFSQLTKVSVNMETFDNFEHLGEAKSDLEVVYLD